MDARIDLHIHSRHSEDGDLTVPQIFTLAESSGLSAISITDHDSTSSIPEALRLLHGSPLRYIPGVEITTVLPEDGSQQHILGYFVDPASERLIAILDTIQNHRITIARKRMDSLRSLGISIDQERVWKMTDGRAPTATSIMKEAIMAKENEADACLETYRTGEKRDNPLMNFYRDFFAYGKPAYVPFESIPTAAGISAVTAAGGIPVLAHPVFVKDRSMLDSIVAQGLRGIEAISSYHSPADIESFISYAGMRGLLVTAGSDFHGPTTKPKVKLGDIQGNRFEYFTRLVETFESLHGK
jgi:3',5'-nucleoside bisphosphate phosphatase